MTPMSAGARPAANRRCTCAMAACASPWLHLSDTEQQQGWPRRPARLLLSFGRHHKSGLGLRRLSSLVERKRRQEGLSTEASSCQSSQRADAHLIAHLQPGHTHTHLLSPSCSCCSSKLHPAVSISNNVGSSAAAALSLQDAKSASVCPATDACASSSPCSTQAGTISTPQLCALAHQ